MRIKIVTLRIQLFGIPFSCAYLAYVGGSDAHTSINPIGRRVVVSDGHSVLTIHTSIPPIETSYLKVRVLDGPKFKTFLSDLFDSYSKTHPNLGVNYDHAAGLQIQYVMHNPLVDPNNSSQVLVHGQTPKQQNIRAILDVIDQLQGYTPRGENTLTFYVNSLSDPQNTFYVSQVTSEMSYVYDGSYLYFMSDEIGRFKYDLLTGNISFELKEPFKKKLVADFRLNYPGALESDIVINTVSLMPDARFAQIKYIERPVHSY